MLAAAGEAVVVGFNVKASGQVAKSADKEGIEVLQFDVIYHLTEKIQEILEGRISDDDGEKILGEFTVKKIFAANKKMAVLGGELLSGKVRKLSQFRVFRKSKNEKYDPEDDFHGPEFLDNHIGSGKIETVQRGPEVVNEISEVGLECGMKVDHKNIVFEGGDRLELFIAKK